VVSLTLAAHPGFLKPSVFVSVHAWARSAQLAVAACWCSAACKQTQKRAAPFQALHQPLVVKVSGRWEAAARRRLEGEQQPTRASALPLAQGSCSRSAPFPFVNAKRGPPFEQFFERPTEQACLEPAESSQNDLNRRFSHRSTDCSPTSSKTVPTVERRTRVCWFWFESCKLTVQETLRKENQLRELRALNGVLTHPLTLL